MGRTLVKPKPAGQIGAGGNSTTVKSRQQFQTGKILKFSRRRPHAMTWLPDTVRSISQPSLSPPRIFKTSRSKL